MRNLWGAQRPHLPQPSGPVVLRSQCFLCHLPMSLKKWVLTNWLTLVLLRELQGSSSDLDWFVRFTLMQIRKGNRWRSPSTLNFFFCNLQQIYFSFLSLFCFLFVLGKDFFLLWSFIAFSKCILIIIRQIDLIFSPVAQISSQLVGSGFSLQESKSVSNATFDISWNFLILSVFTQIFLFYE